MKIIILGAGLVGSPMAIDLSKDEDTEVFVADISPVMFEYLHSFGIKTIQQDLSLPETVKNIVSGYDMVINAVPGFMGFQTLKAIIEAGKNVVDISFFPEDPFLLSELALKNNVIAVMDCGVAPGMMHILTGYAHHQLDETETCLTYVGGLPQIREYPYEYKAVFSPIDVIEEYTRPARYIENYKAVTKEALSDAELLNFPGLGTLEAFNSDGIRSLGSTIKAANIKEKTLRYPGHIGLMKVLRQTGFFSQEPIDVKGTKIKPMDVTAKLLFPMWELKKGEKDLTIMKVIVEGKKDGKKLRYTYDLLDFYDEETQTHSMARTTGYTATVALRMIASGLYRQEGLSVPEYIGNYPECVDFMLNSLAQRGVNYVETIEEIA
ncbi:MAG TPA: saccharopine dehydrogenase C-terminal domain-containing protein [Bacteroidales bacterium]|nr:saccharopine dehydrogenase C-terminal domain-containing protein [Bacteroidales bacterium]HPB26542.1 saccharopine dehydrogenase C-terminal domain-containing protein [Bacteroidales bacterium]HQN15794.1 saccharopine dehydrogenase C-terminal domain-containing protein [Bacteroidales bacterium]